MMTRRDWLAGAALLSPTSLAADDLPRDLIQRTDDALEGLLRHQNTAPDSRYRGGFADADGLYQHGSPGSLYDYGVAAFVTPSSRHHRNPEIPRRIQLAVDFNLRFLSRDGNISLLTTNFNSPPDTAFFLHPLCSAIHNARHHGAPEIGKMLMPLLERTAEGVLRGGVHTPNHRWVICAALAQANAVMPKAEFVRRIDQWLAEGIDINEDGQFSEFSTTVYSPICDRSFVILAHKLQRPELLEPVRRNLNSLLYLLHPGHEVVTEMSVRQDRNQRAKTDRYWFPLQYLAVKDQNRAYGALLAADAHRGASLSTLLEYPELRAKPAAGAIPDNYEKTFRVLKAARIRRGLTSATLMLDGNDRFFSVRRGDAIVQAVRFASAFFGKGQFTPQLAERRGNSYYFEQNLDGPYYQPLANAGRIVDHDEWQRSRPRRAPSEIGQLKQCAWVTEQPDGFEIRVQASGTPEVPVAVEISLAEGKLEGVETLRPGAHLLRGTATYRTGQHGIRISPGVANHRWVQLRGALPKLEGESVYLTGVTPFDHTFRLEWL
jgi:hypothetical protein